jgi:MFS family permease
VSFVALGVALLAGSVLALEIAITRVFAILLWHHLTYMVVSVAMLGFGAAGSLLTAARVTERRGDPAPALAGLAAAYAAALLTALAAVPALRVDVLALPAEPLQLLRLAALYGLFFAPFLAAGAAIALALSRFPRAAARLYGADLLGSALGGIACVGWLGSLGAGPAVALAAVLGLAASAAFALAAERRARAAAVALGLVAAGVALGLAGWPPDRAPLVRWDVPFAPGKEWQLLADRGVEAERIPSATAEVEVGPSLPNIPIIGGDFGLIDRAAATARFVGQDGAAPTMLFEHASEVARFPFLDDTQTASPYVALQARGGRSPQVLVIGVGGGVDVMVALYHGASRVTAVELNRAMIHAVTDRYGDYLGGLFEPDGAVDERGVQLVHGEGRAYVRRHPERWDVIQLSGVDSFTALSSGAYTLSESYLYTVEAVRDLLERLRPDGYVSFSRFFMNAPRKPRESLRLAHVARVALARLGVDDPAAHVVVFRGQRWASTLVKQSPFTPAEVEALDDFASRQGFWGLVYAPPPWQPAAGPSRRYDARARRAFRKALAGTDASDPAIEALVAAYRSERGGREASAEIARAARLVPGRTPAELAALVRQEARAQHPGEAHFAESRRAFGTVIAGSEDERRRVLAPYPYDLSPATDDRPFFFNYYRMSQLLEALGRSAESEPGDRIGARYHPDVPVGHVVLFSSLAQVSVLAALFILWPLLRLRGGVAVPAAAVWRTFVYFGALGLGFMALEISLMQQMVLFLGHPTYAISVVLVVLLCAAGVGSWASARWQPGPALAARQLLWVPATIAAAVLATRFLLPLALSLPLAGRVAAVAAVLVPLGLVLGGLFPLGVRWLELAAPALVPWAWAVNAFLSVVASILAILVAMSMGFAAVAWGTTALYAGGLAAWARWPRAAGEWPQARGPVASRDREGAAR